MELNILNFKNYSTKTSEDEERDRERGEFGQERVGKQLKIVDTDLETLNPSFYPLRRHSCYHTYCAMQRNLPIFWINQKGCSIFHTLYHGENCKAYEML